MKKIFYIFTLSSSLFSEEGLHRCGLSLSDSNRDIYIPPVCSSSQESSQGNFKVHYGACEWPSETSLESTYFSETVNATNAYVSLVLEAAEHSKNLLEEMNFNQEDADNDGIYDIYLSKRPDGQYGVNYPSSEGGSFMLIDNDYSGFTCGPCLVEPTAIELMQITVAHEFFHAVQRTYVASTATSDLYFWELSSTWFEDVAFPSVSDYLNWAHYDYLVDPEQDISSYVPLTGYSLALFGHYLVNEYDQVDNQENSNIMRLIWEDFNGFGVDAALTSIDNVLTTNYNSNFSKAWSDFNTRNIYNGTFNNTENSLYYYEDQQYIPPIEVVPTQNMSNSLTTGEIVTDWGEVDILSYQLNSNNNAFITLDLSDSQNCGGFFGGFDDFVGYLAIESIIGNNWHRFYDLSELYLDSSPRIIALDPGDKFYFVLANKEYNTNVDFCLQIPITYSGANIYTTADLNLDLEIDILDLVLLIDVILDDVNISEYQFSLIDLNNDSILNIIDAVGLIHVILNS